MLWPNRLPASKKRTSKRILVILYGTLFVLCASLIAVAHVYELKGQREEAFERMGTIAIGLSDQIPAGHVTKLLEKYDSRGMLIKNTQDAWYYVMHDHLRRRLSGMTSAPRRTCTAWRQTASCRSSSGSPEDR